MQIIADSCVWSLLLRRQRPVLYPYGEELGLLIKEKRVQMLGMIRQEVLSGIRHREQFESLRYQLSGFPDLVHVQEDYELAATFCNYCCSKGIQGSHTDFLISAVAVRHKMGILTTDKDFERFARYLPIQLIQPRKKYDR